MARREWNVARNGQFRRLPKSAGVRRNPSNPREPAGRKVFTLQTLPACDLEDQFGDTVGKVARFQSARRRRGTRG